MRACMLMIQVQDLQYIVIMTFCSRKKAGSTDLYFVERQHNSSLSSTRDVHHLHLSQSIVSIQGLAILAV
jgi:hypothetical protein